MTTNSVVCRHCQKNVSAARYVAHRHTRTCQAAGLALHMRRLGYVLIGPASRGVRPGYRSLGRGETSKADELLPLLVRGRAPLRIAPTRAQRSGNVPGDGWKDPRELWVPYWLNALLAHEPARRDGPSTVYLREGPLVALLRWAGENPAHAKALAALYLLLRSTRTDGARMRAAAYELFYADNPTQKMKFLRLGHP